MRGLARNVFGNSGYYADTVRCGRISPLVAASVNLLILYILHIPIKSGAKSVKKRKKSHHAQTALVSRKRDMVAASSGVWPDVQGAEKETLGAEASDAFPEAEYIRCLVLGRCVNPKWVKSVRKDALIFPPPIDFRVLLGYPFPKIACRQSAFSYRRKRWSSSSHSGL